MVPGMPSRITIHLRGREGRRSKTRAKVNRIPVRAAIVPKFIGVSIGRGEPDCQTDRL
jgi:hypothetical protein